MVGDSAAPVKVVVFTDFECPFCKSLHEKIMQRMREHPKRVSLSVLHFPLTSHRFAKQAATAFECAESRTAKANMMDLLYAKQDSIGLLAWSAARSCWLRWPATSAGRRLSFLVAAIFLSASEGPAQGARAQYVKEVNFAREFSSVVAVRELPDRSILVGDPMERRVVHLVSPSEQGRTVLSRGSGPGELMSVSRMVAATGDTTLVWDSAQQRVVILVGSRAVRTYSTQEALWKGQVEFPMAFDGSGNVYGLRAKAATARKGPINPGPLSVFGADSAELIVFPKAKLPSRVLLTTRGAFTPSNMVVKTIAGVTAHHQLMALLDRPDLIAVCGDGSILHAASAKGSASWWKSGMETSVASESFARPDGTEERKRQAIVASYGEENARHFSPDEYPPWPKTMPAFETNGAWCLSSGDGVHEGNADSEGRRPHYFVSRIGTVSLINGAVTCKDCWRGQQSRLLRDRVGGRTFFDCPLSARHSITHQGTREATSLTTRSIPTAPWHHRTIGGGCARHPHARPHQWRWLHLAAGGPAQSPRASASVCCKLKSLLAEL